MTAKSDDGLRSPTEADAVYQGFIERLLRIFMAIQFVALVLVALRMYQFPDHAGLLAIHFFLLLISLGLMLLLPPRLIRARIFVFLLVGLLLCALGIYQAGLATSALPGVPVLIIAGENDPLREPGYSDDLAARIPDNERHVYEDCGHCPNIEHAARFNADAIAFLKRIHAA